MPCTDLTSPWSLLLLRDREIGSCVLSLRPGGVPGEINLGDLLGSRQLLTRATKGWCRFWCFSTELTNSVIQPPCKM